ncbi:kinase-like domain-containing protein [Favolaschia claudopus]|uniref:Kinase-like domain-containing protein n=1 Tax=Favolaschia claudopus TaxID=2862362 RepID=A0AAW0BGR8_9AGAR
MNSKVSIYRDVLRACCSGDWRRDPPASRPDFDPDNKRTYEDTGLKRCGASIVRVKNHMMAAKLLAEGPNPKRNVLREPHRNVVILWGQSQLCLSSMRPRQPQPSDLTMIYPGVFILFTEYVEGETIAALARSLGGVEEDGARSITRQILSGVEHIHRQGLIHHDIKGENILISSTGCVKIADAGMTRIDVSDARVLASPFLAPEVYMTVDFDCAIDIWSVGAVIVELLTGRHPWADASVAFLLLKVMPLLSAQNIT